MPRTLLLVPDDDRPVAHWIDLAQREGAAEIVRGVPPALADVVGDQLLPFVHVEPDPSPAPETPVVLPPPSGAWAAGADARIGALSAAVAALMSTTTLPDVDDDVLGELDGLDPLPPTGGGQDLDDILSELEGL